jgi:hypothetical protein
VEWEELKAFFEKHPHLNEKKPGLHKFLLDPYLREKYQVSLDEAESLAGIEVKEQENVSSFAWARELVRYRRKRRLNFSPAKSPY